MIVGGAVEKPHQLLDTASYALFLLLYIVLCKVSTTPFMPMPVHTPCSSGRHSITCGEPFPREDFTPFLNIVELYTCMNYFSC